MRFDVEYRCVLQYDEPVAESQNELRVVPTTDVDQVVLHARVQTTPAARVLTTVDAWGTRVDAFGVRAPHERLEVHAEATVEVLRSPTVEQRVPLEEVADPAFRDEHHELLVGSPMAATDDAVRAFADEVAAGSDAEDVVGLGGALQAAVEDRIAYVRGVTDVGTPVPEVLTAGRGVCQDRAHVLVALARHLGLPARYVSGYLAELADGRGATTHAWVEVAVPGEGWHTLDPCEDAVPGGAKVVIGRGRDYGDVAPMRGTYVGSAEHGLHVAVSIDEVVPVA